MSFGNFKLQISFSGSDELQFMSILIKLIIIYFNLSTKMTSLPVSLSHSLSLSLSPLYFWKSFFRRIFFSFFQGAEERQTLSPSFHIFIFFRASSSSSRFRETAAPKNERKNASGRRKGGSVTRFAAISPLWQNLKSLATF